jgi:hypothetical protein
MPFVNNLVYDQALLYIDTYANRLDICSSDPSTYTQATSTYSDGYKLSPIITTPTARSPSGRKITVTAISDGIISTPGLSDYAAFYALSDTVNSRLLISGALSASFGVVQGQGFTLDTFDIYLSLT